VGLSEENSELIQAIYSLNQQHTEILILRGISGLNTSETAQTLRWTENKVRSTYHRAKKALLEQLGGMSDEE
jgi:RNA polymerase sigma-70 factor (ECF subfamily)